MYLLALVGGKERRQHTMTAGSFVLITLSRGTTFSWIEYLSRMTLFCFGFDLDASPQPFKSSTDSASPLPPHRIWKASRPLILMPMLLVLLNTAAIIGNNSFFTVLKSSTVRRTGSVRRDASTRECVGDSTARTMMGRTSVKFSKSYLKTVVDTYHP